MAVGRRGDRRLGVHGRSGRPRRHRPDGRRAEVYVATSPEVRNRNLVYAPDGTLAAVHDKAYLVPMERDHEAGRGLTAVGLADLEVADLPLGRVATVISKDAHPTGEVLEPGPPDGVRQLGPLVLERPVRADRRPPAVVRLPVAARQVPAGRLVDGRSRGRGRSSPRPSTGGGSVAEGAVWADIEVAERPAPVPLPAPLEAPASTEVAGGTDTQLVPHLAADDDRAWLTLVSCGHEPAQGVMLATDAGDGWSAPTPLAPEPARAHDQFDRQWRPRLTVLDGRPVCIYVAFPRPAAAHLQLRVGCQR